MTDARNFNGCPQFPFAWRCLLHGWRTKSVSFRSGRLLILSIVEIMPLFFKHLPLEEKE